MKPLRRRPLRDRMKLAEAMVNDLDRIVAYRMMVDECAEALECIGCVCGARIDDPRVARCTCCHRVLLEGDPEEEG